MPFPRLRCPDTAEVEAGFTRIRAELDVPEGFPAPVQAEAEAAAVAGPDGDPDRRDRRELDLVTIDPPGSRDLDQAFHAEARGAGHRVHYAIADVAAFVEPGGAMATEAWARGVTLYSPDHRAGLHPEPVSEGAASLLAGQDRPCVLWTIDLAEDGVVESVAVERALVRSRGQLTYREVQDLVDAGDAPPSLARLRPIGEARRDLLRGQGGISLRLPDQEVVEDDGGYRLVYDAPLPVESWNEQISLLTGMAAAALMLDAGFGILRTLPPAPRETIRRLGHSARALGVPWPDDDRGGYAEVLESLDVSVPAHAALVVESARLFRGASYEPFDGEPPADPAHHAIGGPYAHVTAPLRRLVDRYANEIALCAHEGRRPPEWVLAGFDELPGTMARSRQRQGRLDRAAVDFMEAMVLRDRVGAEFDAVVTDVDDERGATLQLLEPAVIVTVTDAKGVEEGTAVRARLDRVDAGAATLDFTVL
ncbi:MAG: RNB domain-containing ribonuclease [Actinomycetota bacterium]